MGTREWLMSERNLADEPVDSLGDMSESERANLALLVRQCRGWSSQNIEEVVAGHGRGRGLPRHHPAACGGP